MSTEKSRTKVIFQPRDLLITSTPAIAMPAQMSFIALGLIGAQQIVFEVVTIPGSTFDPCACPPGQVTLPAVTAVMPLTCCGQRVTLTEANPRVVIDELEGFVIRAVKTNGAEMNQNLYLFARETRIENVNDRMRGCGCATEGEAGA